MANRKQINGSLGKINISVDPKKQQARQHTRFSNHGPKALHHLAPSQDLNKQELVKFVYFCGSEI